MELGQVSILSSQSIPQNNNLQAGGASKKCTQALRVIGVQEESCIAWSPDGKRLAFVSLNSSIYITKEDQNGNFLVENVLIGHKGTVNCLLFHPTDSILVSGGYDGIIIWDYMKGFIVKRIGSSQHDHEAHESNVECLDWLFDGSALVSGGKDSNIKIWDSLKNFSLIETVTGHKAAVMCLAVNGHLLASAGRDSSVKLWDASTIRQEQRNKRDDDSSIKVHLHTSFDGHRGDVVSLAFTRDANILISGARDNEMKLWNLKSNEFIRSIKNHKGDVTQMSLLCKDTVLMSSSVDGTMKCLKLGKSNLMGQESDVIALDELKQESNNINSKNDDLEIPIPSDLPPGLLKGVVDEEKDSILYSFEAHEGVGISDFQMNPVYPLMATSAGHSVRIWRVSTNAVSPSQNVSINMGGASSSPLSLSDKPVLFHEFTGHKDSVNAVFLLPECDSFISGSTDYHLFLYNIKTMKKEYDFNFEGSIYTVTMGIKNDQRVAFVGGNHYDIKGFCLNKEGPTAGREVVRYSGHSGQVQALALNKDVSLLVSGGYDFDLFVWSVKMPFVLRDESIVQKPLHKHSAHKGHITSLSFSENDQYLISASTDHSIIVWSVSNSSKKITKTRTMEQAHSSVISAVVFGKGPSANQYFSGSWEGNIKVWDISKKDKVVFEIAAFENRISSLTVSPNGQVLVACSSSGVIKTYSALAPYNELAVYLPPGDHVCTNSVSSGNDIFISSSENGMISCWPHPFNPEYQSSFN